MCFSRDSKYLAICNGDLHLLNLADGKLHTKGETLCLPTFAPKDDQLAWIESATTVCIMEKPDSNKIRRLPRKQMVKALAYDKDGQLLAAEVQDRTIVLVNLTQGKKVQQIDVAKKQINWAEFTPMQPPGVLDGRR